MGKTSTAQPTPESVMLTTLAALPVLGVVGLAVGLIEMWMSNDEDTAWERGYHKCVAFVIGHTFYLVAVMIALLV